MQHKMKHSSTCLYIGIMTIILIIIIIIWLCSVSVRTSISTLQICWIYVKKHHITKVSIENSWLTFLEDTNVRGAMFFRDSKPWANVELHPCWEMTQVAAYRGFCAALACEGHQIWRDLPPHFRYHTWHRKWGHTVNHIHPVTKCEIHHFSDISNLFFWMQLSSTTSTL